MNSISILVQSILSGSHTMESGDRETESLRLELEDLKEALFLAQADLEKSRTVNIALRGFIQNLYESCEAMEDTELQVSQVIENLRKNIRVFAKDHLIRL